MRAHQLTASSAQQGEQTIFFNNGEVENRILRFPGPTAAPTLVFVPNWRAKAKHWRPFVEVLRQSYTVLYFETREKTATCYRSVAPDLSVKAMAADLASFINSLDGPYHLAGASVGTSTILRAWPSLRQKPLSLALLCPVLKVKMPVYFRVFPWIRIEAFTRVAPLVYQLMRTSPRLKSVRTTLHRAMTERDFSEIARMKASVEALQAMPDPLSFCGEPTTETLIVRCPEDRLHDCADATRISKRFATTETAIRPNFRAVHERETAIRLLRFLQNRKVG